MMNTDLKLQHSTHVQGFYDRIFEYIERARTRVQRSIDNEMVKVYWLIGQEIFIEEQAGKERAAYGTHLLEILAKSLTKAFGRGFSVSTLKDIRQFYIAYRYPNLIGHALSGQFNQVLDPHHLNPYLSWTHYRLLMRISRPEVRQFYEIEAVKNKWSARELERQIDSLLFERLSKSKDKEGLMQLAFKGQEITRPVDAIKDPFVLEFLNIPQTHQMTESKLEEALIENLKLFLLELGKGFAFIGRQKRITLAGDHFYADLVFYHVILKCYVIIDIKTRKLSHEDLGQIQFYVNYYDQEMLSEGDNPTIGLILCTQKNDAMVRYTLGDKNKQIFASKYQFHLPTEAELEAELKRELEVIGKQKDLLEES